PASPYADYYVWSSSDRRFADARIIFVDTEKSNWTLDPTRRQYYWHRFFSHQPDLNYDNSAVRHAMLDVMRFWLDRGLDGFRCDALPYLVERQGPSCHELRNRAGDARDPQGVPRGHRPRVRRRPSPARRSQPVAGGRASLLRRRRRVPHVLPLPADAAPLSGPSARGHTADHRHLHPHAADPAGLPVGTLPKKPRRADARDGDERRARVHVLRVRA